MKYLQKPLFPVGNRAIKHNHVRKIDPKEVLRFLRKRHPCLTIGFSQSAKRTRNTPLGLNGLESMARVCRGDTFHFTIYLHFI